MFKNLPTIEVQTRDFNTIVTDYGNGDYLFVLHLNNSWISFDGSINELEELAEQILIVTKKLRGNNE